MHELLHHTCVALVAEPNLIVDIIVILPKLGILELKNLAVGHKAVDDECSPHLPHLHTLRIIRFFAAARPLARILYSREVSPTSCCIIQLAME